MRTPIPSRTTGRAALLVVLLLVAGAAAPMVPAAAQPVAPAANFPAATTEGHMSMSRHGHLITMTMTFSVPVQSIGFYFDCTPEAQNNFEGCTVAGKVEKTYAGKEDVPDVHLSYFGEPTGYCTFQASPSSIGCERTAADHSCPEGATSAKCTVQAVPAHQPIKGTVVLKLLAPNGRAFGTGTTMTGANITTNQAYFQ